jgi:hypothetical protein
MDRVCVCLLLQDLVQSCLPGGAGPQGRTSGSGPRTTLAGDANTDIMTSIIECVRERVLRGARTFLIKVKAHRGEPLNERADTQAENARQLPSECRQWTTRSQRMTYEWNDNDGVKHVTAWSKAVRNAMLRGGAEFQRQKALNRAATNWNRAFLRTTDIGLHRIEQAASTGAQSDLMDSTRSEWRCMLQLQEADTWEKPAATTWAAEFLLKEGESREFLLPCGKWLHMIGDVLPTETVAQIQSAGCKAQQKSVIGAHNRC